ncbi:MAG: DUF6930 domain-containing protein [Terrimicrobiaceae bacterium]
MAERPPPHPPYSRWRKRCYLPLMLIMVDATSGFVLGFETISTKEGFDAAIESLMAYMQK